MRTVILIFSLILQFVAIGLLVIGCKDDNYDGKTLSSPVIYGEVTPYTPETTDVWWKATRSLGVYMVNEAGTEYYYTNAPYTASVSGNSFAQFHAKTPVYFPKSGEKVDIIMYAPYNSSQTGNGLIRLNTHNQSEPGNADVLYGRSKGHSVGAANVELSIRHLLAKVRFKLVTEQNGREIAIPEFTMKLTDIVKEGTFNLITEEFALTGGASDIVICIDETEEYQASAFVIPAAINDIGVEITLPDLGKTYTEKLSAHIDNTDKLESASLYTFKLQLTDLGITITLESIVNDWKDGNGNGEDVGISDGTIKPGTDVNDWTGGNGEDVEIKE